MPSFRPIGNHGGRGTKGRETKTGAAHRTSATMPIRSNQQSVGNNRHGTRKEQDRKSGERTGEQGRNKGERRRKFVMLEWLRF